MQSFEGASPAKAANRKTVPVPIRAGHLEMPRDGRVLARDAPWPAGSAILAGEMPQRARRREHWKAKPDPKDYTAAADYLSLVMPPRDADRLARRLKAAELVVRKAKDLLRASGLPALGPENRHVRDDLRKIAKGELLSPVVLVRGEWQAGAALLIADGYHRICASYHLDEDTVIPCQIVSARS